MNCFKEIHIEQGTEEWLLYRRSHIMATDSAKIMNKNPWSSAYNCYIEKIEGKKNFITEAMQRGMDLEPKARDCLIENFEVILKPKVFESVKHPFMGASLDAISDDNKILYEIKCVGEKTMQKALNGHVDPMYTIQCNKQMLIMGLKSMFLFYYYNNFLNHLIKIDIDETIIKAIIKSDTKFWNEHISPQVPPEKYGENYERIENEKANNLAQQWLEWHLKEKEAKNAKENILKQLEKYTDHKNCIFPEVGLKYQVIERKGAVDWNMACSTWEVTEEELDKFRKNKSNYQKLSEM